MTRRGSRFSPFLIPCSLILQPHTHYRVHGFSPYSELVKVCMTMCFGKPSLWPEPVSRAHTHHGHRVASIKTRIVLLCQKADFFRNLLSE